MTDIQPMIVPADPKLTTSGLLVERVKQTPDKPLFSKLEGDDKWSDVTSKEFEQEVIAVAKGLVAKGLKPGEMIGFMGKTHYDWTLIDFAIWYAGAIMVPIYDTSSAKQLEWILSDSGSAAMISQYAEHDARVQEVIGQLPNVRFNMCLEKGAIAELIEAGKGIADSEIEKLRNLAKPSDIATLIYTSGSTGKPKGVVLTHSNFVDLSRNSYQALNELLVDASTVLFITLAHVFARFISVLSIHAGVKIGHQPDTSKLTIALGSFKPTFLLAVPRVFEKVYNAAEQKTEGEGKGKIFRAAAEVAIKHSEALETGKIPFGLKLKFKLFDKLVYGKLRALLGGNVKFAVSGSAPLGHRLSHFYRSLGVVILEGYGLTETTAPVTINRPNLYKIGTVGPALPGCGMRIAADGEVETTGINIFREYWKNPEGTADAFTEDGWFKTGDIGSIDADGYLTITGRKKEIIITAGGKNIAPAQLEDPVRAHPLVSQIVVVGDRKPFVSALITLDAEMLPTWLKNNGEDQNISVAEASKLAKVQEAIQEAVNRANAEVSRAESIRKFIILEHDFTELSGHLTPKLSIKRHVILEDFKETIEGLYADTKQLN